MAVRFPMSPGKTIKVVAAKCALSLLVVVAVARAPFDFDIEINTSADRSEGKTSGSYFDRNFLLTFSFWKKVEKKGKKKKKGRAEVDDPLFHRLFPSCQGEWKENGGGGKSQCG